MKEKNYYLSESDFFAMKRQRNIVAYLCGLLILLLAIAIYSISSVAKWSRPEPFLLKKSDVTGQMEIYQPYKFDEITIREDDLYKQSLIANYVIKREEYYWFDFERSQKYVNTFTEGNALASYKNQVNPEVEGTLPNLLKNQGFAKIKVNNIQQLNTYDYQVRWTVSISTDGVRVDQSSLEFVTLVKFRVGSPHAELSKRLLNPFGVYIYEYKTNQSS